MTKAYLKMTDCIIEGSATGVGFCNHGNGHVSGCSMNNVGVGVVVLHNHDGQVVLENNDIKPLMWVTCFSALWNTNLSKVKCIKKTSVSMMHHAVHSPGYCDTLGHPWFHHRSAGLHQASQVNIISKFNRAKEYFKTRCTCAVSSDWSCNTG